MTGSSAAAPRPRFVPRAAGFSASAFFAAASAAAVVLDAAGAAGVFFVAATLPLPNIARAVVSSAIVAESVGWMPPPPPPPPLPWFDIKSSSHSPAFFLEPSPCSETRRSIEPCVSTGSDGIAPLPKTWGRDSPVLTPLPSERDRRVPIGASTAAPEEGPLPPLMFDQTWSIVGAGSAGAAALPRRERPAEPVPRSAGGAV
mmetsp:Transcript_2129/g.6902  ORF Transcript_2129/g.6902 Transcript_2129/m.6902 type:complete len:201 (-) Transcript_2129:179-781(-)